MYSIFLFTFRILFWPQFLATTKIHNVFLVFGLTKTDMWFLFIRTKLWHKFWFPYLFDMCFLCVYVCVLLYMWVCSFLCVCVCVCYLIYVMCSIMLQIPFWPGYCPQYYTVVIDYILIEHWALSGAGPPI